LTEVLVYVDHAGGAVRKPTLELLTLARRIGEPVAVHLGPGAETAAPVLAEHGAVKVLAADAGEFADYVIAPKVDALQAAYVAVSPAAVLVPSSAEGKEIAARLAVRIGSGLITDAVDLEPGAEGPIATQSVFAAAFTTRSRVTHGTPVITVKPNAAPVEPAPAAGTLEPLAVTIAEASKGTKVLSRTPRESTGRPELTEAALVVAGGRGVGGTEHFGLGGADDRGDGARVRDQGVRANAICPGFIDTACLSAPVPNSRRSPACPSTRWPPWGRDG